eukprot:TRINITY_DN58642_c0_g2_i1.p2 TRINITY_DN58642_c0_g2~~TRINITY_DN58642_c0_g2_i1.p2  ORF type:complete len:330 (+),score=42.55 TRINITY_DN58642_c0_g2_i1:19-1008(+)
MSEKGSTTEKRGREEEEKDPLKDTTAEWNAIGPKYNKYIADVMAQGSTLVYDKMLAYIEELKQDKLDSPIQILDVGCGPGEPSLTLCRKLGEKVYCTGVDLVQPMVEEAKRRQKENSITNAEFHQKSDADLDGMADWENKFGIVNSSLVVQYVPHAVTTLKRFRRVLKPGGKVVLLVWGDEDKVPWLSLGKSSWALTAPDGTPRDPAPDRAAKKQKVLEAKGTEEEDPDDTPDCFRYGSAEKLKKHLERAGFGDVQVHTEDLKLEFPNFDALWGFFNPAGFGPEGWAPHVKKVLLKSISSLLGQEELDETKPLTLPAQVQVGLGTKPQA